MAKLIYLMGASGAGKDTLLNYLRQQADLIPQETSKMCLSSSSQVQKTEDRPFLIAHRYITREAINSNENHIQLTETEFKYRQTAGFFIMSWTAHGLHYGIGQEIANWLAQGCDVVVNGSRAYLPEAKLIFGSDLLAVCLTVPEQVLRARLIARGRESRLVIEQRLERAARYATDLPKYTHFIENDGDIKLAAKKIQALVKLINSQTKGSRDVVI